MVVAVVVVVVVAEVVVVVVVRSTEQRVLSSNNIGLNCHCQPTPEAGQLIFENFVNKNFLKTLF